jgi:hypothetical protein
MTKAAPKKRTRKYRVLYAVTRSEYYEIEATSAREAEDRAFSEGELVDDLSEATSVVECDVEEIKQ